MEESSTPTTKACKKCGHPKALEAFYVDRAAPDGHRKTCIECDKARKRTPEVKEQSHRYYHSPKGKAAEQRYRESEKGQATRAAYEQLPERIERRKVHARKASLRYYYRVKDTPEYRAKLADPAWQEKRRAHVRKWLSKPEAWAQHRLRAHLRREVDPTQTPLTLTEWEHAVAYFGCACAYCGKPGPVTQDHFTPVAKGGRYTADNIVPACDSCNKRKNRTLPEVWCAPVVYANVMAYFASLTSSSA